MENEKKNFIGEIYVDPVCWMKVMPARETVKTTYKMRTYYFCAETCRKAFESNPEKYLDTKPSRLKTWWLGYLKRLNNR